MEVNLWGTRGSIASPGPDTVRYGGNTSCVSIKGTEGTLIVLDAGTGIRVLGQELPEDIPCVNILLTHLHMDHVQGLPFFEPLRRPGVEVHIWGPASTTLKLEDRLHRYLSPPLFPVRVRDLLSKLYFHEIIHGKVEIGEFQVYAQMVIHPNPTVGFRIEGHEATVTYLPDHEPALGSQSFPEDKEWTSGYYLAEGADLLIHDSQYSPEEYEDHLGFGHSSILDTFRFAQFTDIKQLVPFHHDPAHNDNDLDGMIENAQKTIQPKYVVTPGKEGLSLLYD